MNIPNPIKLFWPYELEFVNKKHEAGDVYTFTFKPKSQIKWQAGQYIDYRLGPRLVKHFTIASAQYEDVINISTRIFEKPSKFKSLLLELNKGDIVQTRKPKGDLYIDNPKMDHVFIAGGIGITPYRAILWDEAQKRSTIKITLFYFNSTNDFSFKDELDSIATNNPGVKIVYSSDNSSNEELLKKYIKPETEYFVSGPPKMVESYVRILRKEKIPYRNIKSDSFLGY